jgi:hypothetical protein
MFTKLKNWIIGSVIMKKVIGKFAKHATGALVGILASPKVAPILDKFGISVDSAAMEASLIIVLVGLFGSIWNYIEHRIIKK